MSEEGPKLYANKPKKAQLKQFQELYKGKDFPSPASSSAAAASYAMGSQSSSTPPPPPPQPPKESFARRYKFLWPLLLTVNLVVGAYLFIRTNNKDTSTTEEEVTKDATIAPVSTATAATILTPAVTEPVKLREPIPEDQQRELLKWILEEKRKVKPKDSEEKKRNNEEKAILKQLIRAKSIPSI